MFNIQTRTNTFVYRTYILSWVGIETVILSVNPGWFSKRQNDCSVGLEISALDYKAEVVDPLIIW